MFCAIIKTILIKYTKEVPRGYSRDKISFIYIFREDILKKNILIGVIVVVLIVAGVVAWYFLKGSNKTVVVPTPKQTETVNPNPLIPSGSPAENMSFSDEYNRMTQAQKDCLKQALGQTKLDGFLKNDLAVMQTITGDEYEKASACPQ